MGKLAYRQRLCRGGKWHDPAHQRCGFRDLRVKNLEKLVEIAFGDLRPLPDILDDIVHALLLDAIAHDLLGESRTAEADIERALDLAEAIEVPGGTLYLPRRLPDGGRHR